MLDTLARYIDSCKNELSEILSNMPFSKQKTKYLCLKRFIENYSKLCIYGFNSSRYDIPVIAPILFSLMNERYGIINIIKKVHSIFPLVVDLFILKTFFYLQVHVLSRYF